MTQKTPIPCTPEAAQELLEDIKEEDIEPPELDTTPTVGAAPFVYDEEAGKLVNSDLFEKTQNARDLKERRVPNSSKIDVLGGSELSDSGFHPVEIWDEVPSISDNFFDRLERIEGEDWELQELYFNLKHGRFEDTPYKKGTGESVLASMYGFWFGNSRKTVAYLMEDLPYDTKYERSPAHRKSVLDFATSSQFIYCEGLEWSLKAQVVDVMSDKISCDASYLAECTVDEKRFENYSERHICRTLNVLEAEGMVERRRDGNQILWCLIGDAEKYLKDIDATIEKYTLKEHEVVIIEEC